jgi:hypothetical protein
MSASTPDCRSHFDPWSWPYPLLTNWVIHKHSWHFKSFWTPAVQSLSLWTQLAQFCCVTSNWTLLKRWLIFTAPKSSVSKYTPWALIILQNQNKQACLIPNRRPCWTIYISNVTLQNICTSHNTYLTATSLNSMFDIMVQEFPKDVIFGSKFVSN